MDNVRIDGRRIEVRAAPHRAKDGMQLRRRRPARGIQRHPLNAKMRQRLVLIAKATNLNIDELRQLPREVIHVDTGAAINIGRVFVGKEKGFHGGGRRGLSEGIAFSPGNGKNASNGIYGSHYSHSFHSSHPPRQRQRHGRLPKRGGYDKPPCMNHGEKILIAEDEADVQELVSLHLRNAGFVPLSASDGPEAIRRAKEESPGLILLDIMLAGMNGLEVCRLLKADVATTHIPLIMLTAKAEEPDRITGLELGADDYMTKPFSPRELVLRVKSVLRRSTPAANHESTQLKAGLVAVDRERHIVRVRGKQVELTATEFKLLTLLIERRGRVQGRDGLLNEVWGYESAIDTRTVDTHVRRLREKLGPAADCIETIRGFGYRVPEE